MRSYFSAVCLLFITMSQGLVAVQEDTPTVYLGYIVQKAGVSQAPGTITLRNDFMYHDAKYNKHDTKIKTYADLLAAEYVTSKKLLGGDYGYGIMIPIKKIDGRRKYTSRTNTTVNDANGVAQPVVVEYVQKKQHEDIHGLGDIVITPCILGWHWDTLHARTAVALYTPTGKFSNDKFVNIGRNCWSVDVGGALTWLPKTNTEISINAGVTANTTNHKAHYRSGTECHADFLLAQNITPNFELGIAGFWYQQVNGDHGSGAHNGSNKGRLLGIGPLVELSFTLWKVPMNMVFRDYYEIDSRNIVKGNRFYFTLAAYF